MAIIIEVEPLMGWLTSRDFSNGRLGKPEYPLQPDRVFSAAVAAWATGGEDPEEANALLALEGQAPTILCPPLVSTSKTDLYVKVNNVHPQKDQADQPLALPDFRVGAPKTVIRIHPREGSIFYAYPEVDGSHLPALRRMARRVGYLGGTESLVRVAVHSSLPEDVPEEYHTMKPVGHGDGRATRLRVPQEGRLAILQAHHAAIERVPSEDRGRKFTPAPPAATRPYVTSSSAGEPAVSGMAGSWLCFRRAPNPDGSRGRSLSAGMSAIVSKQVRRTLIAVLRDASIPIPPALVGHDDGPGPRHGRNVAIQPLLDVGHPHATGRIFGFTVIMPDDLAPVDRRSIEFALGRLAADDGILHIPLPPRADVDDRLLVWDVAPVGLGISVPRVFKASRWAERSRDWATVTPIITDRLPKTRRHLPKEVARSCVLAGLPQPECVVILKAPAVEGAPHAGVFGGRQRRHDRKNAIAQRPITHALIRFPVDVVGPVIVGSGRYNGMGLCSPAHGLTISWQEGAAEHDAAAV